MNAITAMLVIGGFVTLLWLIFELTGPRTEALSVPVVRSKVILPYQVRVR